MIYLDTASGTPMRAEVREVMLPLLEGLPPNANAAHRGGRRARKAVGAAREQVAGWLGVSDREIIFTSGGTEANVLAVLGTAEARPGRRRIVSTGIEHPSVEAALAGLEARGWEVARAGVDARGGIGGIDPDRLISFLDEGTGLVCIHLGNHDVGTIQPVRAVAAAARARGIPVFCDATFSAGWVEARPADLGVDLLSLAPYRFFGPQGVGILWKRESLPLRAVLGGGRQEGGLRAGTQNVAAIAGAGEAARLAQAESADWRERTRAACELLWNEIQSAIKGVRLYGPPPGEERMPQHLSLSFDRVEGEALMLNLDVAGVAVSAGAGCLPAREKVSPVLRAMGVEEREAQGLILLGPGPSTTEAEMTEAVARIAKGVERIRGVGPRVG